MRLPCALFLWISRLRPQGRLACACPSCPLRVTTVADLPCLSPASLVWSFLAGLSPYTTNTQLFYVAPFPLLVPSISLLPFVAKPIQTPTFAVFSFHPFVFSSFHSKYHQLKLFLARLCIKHPAAKPTGQFSVLILFEQLAALDIVDHSSLKRLFFLDSQGTTLSWFFLLAMPHFSKFSMLEDLRPQTSDSSSYLYSFSLYVICVQSDSPILCL